MQPTATAIAKNIIEFIIFIDIFSVLLSGQKEKRRRESKSLENGLGSWSYSLFVGSTNETENTTRSKQTNNQIKATTTSETNSWWKKRHWFLLRDSFVWITMQTKRWFFWGNTVKTISAHWNKDTEMLSREFGAEFWTLAKIVNYIWRFVILGDMLASKHHSEFIWCVLFFPNSGCLFLIGSRSVASIWFFGTWFALKPYWFWWASLKHVVMVKASKWGYFIEHKPGTEEQQQRSY